MRLLVLLLTLAVGCGDTSATDDCKRCRDLGLDLSETVDEDGGGVDEDGGTVDEDLAGPRDLAGRPDLARPRPDLLEPTGLRLRVMAANLTSGNGQSYDAGHGIRIFQGLKPDVVVIQEFRYGNNTDKDIRAFVDRAFGPGFSYFRESEGGDSLPNGVISRYPIASSGEWADSTSSNRDFAWAEISLPGGRRLWAVSVHLLTSNAGERDTQAKKVVSYVQKNVPDGDLLVVGGDFNTSSRTEKCLTSFAQVLVTSAPYPVDQDGNGNTSAKRSSPLDWLLVDRDLAASQVPVEIGAGAFPSGLVFDSRVYDPLTDVTPVLKSDSGAPSMQHMAVVRDFAF